MAIPEECTRPSSRHLITIGHEVVLIGAGEVVLLTPGVTYLYPPPVSDHALDEDSLSLQIAESHVIAGEAAARLVAKESYLILFL